MRIHVKSDGKEFTIPAPLSLAIKVLSKGGVPKSEAGIEITEEQAEEYKRELKKLAKGIREAKKVWGHLVIVEVKEKDGDEVIITL